ncbi:MAG: hypothetical protein CL512_03955 [Actinobacteria bacterium]|nr:hypothetical protein [Actinomycetota bacterium]
MSADKLTISIDSSQIGKTLEESLIIVPRESWGKELRKVFSSSSSNKEKIKAMMREASSLYNGGSLYEPRSASVLVEEEGEVIFGLPFSIHGDHSEYDIETVALGVVKADDTWTYASTLSHSSPTEFLLTSEIENGDAGFLSLFFDESAEKFKFIPESASEIEAFIIHRKEVSTKTLNLSEYVVAEIFDLGRSVSSYSEIEFILTGDFVAPSTSLPAIDTGSGYAKGSTVIIKLGTESSPCFILGKGGSTGGNGGPALLVGDMGATFNIEKVNSASFIGGGGGGGPKFKCFSKETRRGIAVRGSGGVADGSVQGDFKNQDSSSKKGAEYNSLKIYEGSPSSSQVESEKIKQIKSGTVYLFNEGHSLTNGSRVIISDTSPSSYEICFGESIGSSAFKIYNDAELTQASPLNYQAQSGDLVSVSSKVGLGGIGEKLYGDGGYGLEIQTTSNSYISSREADFQERVMLDGDALDEAIRGKVFSAYISEPGNTTTWVIGEFTGDLGSNAWGGTTPDVYFLNSSSGTYSYLGREGILEGEEASLLGYEDFIISGNGGWYGEDGQRSRVKKIYDEDLYRSSAGTEGASEDYQGGGAAGPAILTATTNIQTNGENVYLRSWISGDISTFSQDSKAFNNKILDEIKDNNNEYVQEDLANDSVSKKLFSKSPVLVGGVEFNSSNESFDSDSSSHSISGIFSE